MLDVIDAECGDVDSPHLVAAPWATTPIQSAVSPSEFLLHDPGKFALRAP